jgi:hypothetical protein
MLSWQVGRSGVDHPHRRDGFAEHQRKGMGSALLTQVIAEYRRRAGWSASIWAPAKRAGASTQASASNWSPTSPSGLWNGPSQRRTRGLWAKRFSTSAMGRERSLATARKPDAMGTGVVMERAQNDGFC